jgi:hypothetical protein
MAAGRTSRSLPSAPRGRAGMRRRALRHGWSLHPADAKVDCARCRCVDFGGSRCSANAHSPGTCDDEPMVRRTRLHEVANGGCRRSQSKSSI